MTAPEPWRGDAPDESEMDEAPWHEEWEPGPGWPENLAGPEYRLNKPKEDV